MKKYFSKTYLSPRGTMKCYDQGLNFEGQGSEDTGKHVNAQAKTVYYQVANDRPDEGIQKGVETIENDP